MEWTKQQIQAIYENKSNILVAAAAGSGKTAVLVERIINKVINENVDLDKLLIVTFTNAAASEMRERILKAIYKKIDEEPDNKNLQRQIILLNKSNICTIHSFCLDVIKNNFFEIDMPANFKIGEETEIEILKQDTLEELFEEKYESHDKDFLSLIDTYATYRGDEQLKEIIFKIHRFIRE
ncbi:MAG: UvrD-helicase domain-containing protein [Clostridia bacterium]|nr:UvrD-helicase domain-containing protein [Clostridia bacterium]